MHVVVIRSWQEDSPDVIQTVSDILGTTAFEAQQRMIGGGPAVIAHFADLHKAEEISSRLNQNGIAALVVDAAAAQEKSGYFIVRSSKLSDLSLYIEAIDGKHAEVPYETVDLFLPGISASVHSETKTVTEHKINVGMTILTGGIPIPKKVKHQEELKSEQRNRVLYLYAENCPTIVLSEHGLIPLHSLW